METKEDVKIVRIDYQCPECKIGNLRPTGNVFTTDPPRFPHICNNPNCTYGEIFNKTYPYIDYDSIDYFHRFMDDEIINNI